MSYYISKKLEGDFNETVQKVTDQLKEEGFGILTEIDVDHVLKEKLDVDFNRYKILGACNPQYAHGALQIENKVGTMLPCNVIVRKTDEGEIEIAAVDPIASMTSIENEELQSLATEVKSKLARVIQRIL